jgi:hypothetical protein
MIRLTWKAGSEFLDEKGPSVAIMLFMSFMSWILFWPHGLNVSMAIGKEPEAVKYEKVKTAYSENAAELMRLDEDIFSRSLSILDTKKYYCLLTEYFDTGYEGGLQPAALLRYESLCDVFADAAAMVDTYADRLNGWGGFYPELHEFTLHSRGKEQRVGPFLTQAECIEIADRLASLGEHASSCAPFGHSPTQPYRTALVAGQG